MKAVPRRKQKRIRKNEKQKRKQRRKEKSQNVRNKFDIYYCIFNKNKMNTQTIYENYKLSQINRKPIISKNDLPILLEEVLKEMDGNGYILDISKKFWIKYKDNITPNNNLFYTWHYDIRWAATELRKNNIMVRPDLEKGLWTLA